MTVERSIFVAAPDMMPETWALELGGTRIAAESDLRELYDLLTLHWVEGPRYLSHAFMLALCFTEHQYAADTTSIEHKYRTNSWGMRRSKADPEIPGTIIDTPRGQFVKYEHWADSLLDCIYALVHPDFVYQQEHRETIRTVIARWSPNGDFDNNAERRMEAVAAIMARLAPVVPPEATKGSNMPTKPPMTSKPSPNRNGYGGTRRVDAILWHITAGTDSLPWLTNPASKASSNYLIARNGTIYELVKPTEDAWANGAVNKPNLANPLVAKWKAESVNFNQRTISIEHEGFSSKGKGGSLTAAQVASTVALTAWLCATFKLTPDRVHIFGHSFIDSVNRADCPGFSEQEWATWVGKVASLVNGAPAPTADPGFPGALQPDGTTKLNTVDFEGTAVTVEEVIVQVRNKQGEQYRRRWSGHKLDEWERI